VAQVVETLSSKHEALISNPSTTTTTTKKKKKLGIVALAYNFSIME
jgi:hypothetical protein